MRSNTWQYQSNKTNQFWNLAIAPSRSLLEKTVNDSYRKKINQYKGFHLLVSDINSPENVYFYSSFKLSIISSVS